MRHADTKHALAIGEIVATARAVLTTHKQWLRYCHGTSDHDTAHADASDRLYNQHGEELKRLLDNLLRDSVGTVANDTNWAMLAAIAILLVDGYVPTFNE